MFDPEKATNIPNSEKSSLLIAFIAMAGGIMALRFVTLFISNAELGPDESQYWFWSRTLEFGYYSKPPLIAWAIAATTALFGNSEWAVRISAPLFHLGAAIFIFLTGRSLFSERVAFWAGLFWLLMPGVVLSSFIIATDAPLLFFWCASLFAFFQIALCLKNGLTMFILLGVGLGLGLMSKYAMIYFLLASGLVFVFERSIRSEFATWKSLVTLFVAMAIFTPNIFWNAANDFQTVSHTADNANWGADLFQFRELATFLFGQFAVAGLILVAFLMLVANEKLRQEIFRTSKLRALVVFVLTPLLFVSIQAFISRAHANWAASAYPAMVILVTWALVEIGRTRILQSIFSAHLLVFILASTVLFNLTIVDRFGFSSAVRQVRGWDEQAGIIATLGNGADAIVVDDRWLMGAMLYYQREAATEVVAIDVNSNTSDHFEAFKAFDPERHKNVLFVTSRADAAHVDYRFRNITPLGPVSVQVGEFSRTYHAFELSGYFGK